MHSKNSSDSQIGLGLRPRPILAVLLESDLSLEAHRHLHRLKPEKKDLNPSPFDQKGRPLNQMISLAVLQGDVK